MTGSNKGLRILIVEDDTGDQELLTELLVASVITIQLLHTAETLAKAIDSLQKEEFDIIFLDLSLPDSSGIDTFKTIKEHTAKTPVIILSGLADMNIAVEAISLGAQDYHIKGDLDEKTMNKTILYSIERKRAEKLMKESEERYKALVENAPEALVVLDVENRKFVSVSESAEKLFKMTRDELLQIGPVEVSPAYQPGGQLSAELATEKISEAIDGGKHSFEWTHCDKEGNPIPCEVWLVRLPSETQTLIRGSIIDITIRKKAEQELEESYKAIRKLTEHLQNIREEERAHIAREIHDELGQQLTVLKMDISWINKKMGIQDETVKARMKELLVMLDETVRSVRRISSELRPSLLDDLGLTAAMEWQLTEFEKRFQIKTHFKPDDTEIKLPESMKTGLFRIFQESLTNVARHSKAKKVTVTLHIENGSIVLSVADNGVGFDKQNTIGKKSLGVLGMQERTSMIGGTYDISGKPGKGTRVVVTIPLVDSNKN